MIKARVDDRPLGDFKKKHVTAATRAALLEAAEVWHATMLPQRFRAANQAKYGHAPRTRTYLRSKGRRGILDRSIYWSGDTERASRAADITVRGRRGRVKMNLPEYVTMRRRNPNYPDLRRELTTTTPDEERALGEVMQRAVVDHLTALGSGATFRRSRRS